MRKRIRLPGQSDIDRELITIEAYKAKIKNPLSAIRSLCVECMGGSFALIKDCTSVDCSLHQFRMGTNPFHKRKQKEDVKET